jgi:hypothetical protein
LDEIEVQVTQRGDSVEIRTRGTRSGGNASVDLEISAPANTRLKVDTGAGAVELRDITAGIDVHSGAASIDAQGAEGTARLV